MFAYDLPAAIAYDLEFAENGRTILPISIALVGEGREYYAVNQDLCATSLRGLRLQRRIRKHKWLMENVIPSLPQGHGDERLTLPKRWLVNRDDQAVKPMGRIAEEVRVFIRDAGPTVTLWGDYVAYDHVSLAQLWGDMMALPAGVPMFSCDIQQERTRRGLRPDELPRQTSGVHNALADARHVRETLLWLAEQDAATHAA